MAIYLVDAVTNVGYQHAYVGFAHTIERARELKAWAEKDGRWEARIVYSHWDAAGQNYRTDCTMNPGAPECKEVSE